VVQELRHKVIKRVSAGGFHTVCLCEDNTLYSWGSGSYGELGLNSQMDHNKPTQIKMPSEVCRVPSETDPDSWNFRMVEKGAQIS
jgi:alpha-tubulin suppressor-like RCC1 family protein